MAAPKTTYKNIDRAILSIQKALNPPGLRDYHKIPLRAALDQLNGFLKTFPQAVTK